MHEQKNVCVNVSQAQPNADGTSAVIRGRQLRLYEQKKVCHSSRKSVAFIDRTGKYDCMKFKKSGVGS